MRRPTHASPSCRTASTRRWPPRGAPRAGRDVVVFGAAVARQCLDAGVLDAVVAHITTVLLGDGIRLYGEPGAAPVRLERTAAGSSGQVTDLRFRVVR